MESDSILSFFVLETLKIPQQVTCRFWQHCKMQILFVPWTLTGTWRKLKHRILWGQHSAAAGSSVSAGEAGHRAGPAPWAQHWPQEQLHWSAPANFQVCAQVSPLWGLSSARHSRAARISSTALLWPREHSQHLVPFPALRHCRLPGTHSLVSTSSLAHSHPLGPFQLRPPYDSVNFHISSFHFTDTQYVLLSSALICFWYLFLFDVTVNHVLHIHFEVHC